MNPVVTFTMQGGKTFKAELYPDKAPNTVNNFISLVRNHFLRRVDLSSRDRRLHDSGRRSRGERNGRPGVYHQGESAPTDIRQRH